MPFTQVDDTIDGLRSLGELSQQLDQIQMLFIITILSICVMTVVVISIVRASSETQRQDAGAMTEVTNAFSEQIKKSGDMLIRMSKHLAHTQRTNNEQLRKIAETLRETNAKSTREHAKIVEIVDAIEKRMRQQADSDDTIPLPPKELEVIARED